MKQTIKKLAALGIILVCAFVSVQYIPTTSAVAAVEPVATVTVPSQQHAVVAQSADVLQVVSVGNLATVTSSTIQATAEPLIVSVLTLQSTNDVATTISTDANTLGAASVLAVTSLAHNYFFANGSAAHALQEAISASTAPVRDAALLPTQESSDMHLPVVGYAIVLLLASLVLITHESKGFGLSDRTTVMRC